MSEFKYALKQHVFIVVSKEHCLVIGKAAFTESENQYYLRYKNGQGVAVESWWNESALSEKRSGSETK